MKSIPGKNILFYIIFFVMLLIVIFISPEFTKYLSCNSPNRDLNKGHSASMVQKGGTVVIGIQQDFDSFNELNAADSDALEVINEMLFMTLTKLDANLESKPYLAKSWEFSEHGKTLTYKLRDDIYWSDAFPTTAHDVYFTWQLATHPDVNYPGISRFDKTDSVNVVDDYTIQFTFKNPYPDILIDTMMPILPKHILEKIPAKDVNQSFFNRAPVGNGPFKLVEWKANRHVIFEANKTFAPGPPNLDKVIFSIQPDETVMIMNLQTGAVDVVPYMSNTSFNNLLNIPNIKTKKYPSKGYSFLAWNCARPVLSTPVRKALSHSINKQEIIDTLLDGYAEPAIGPFLPFVSVFDTSLRDLEFNPNHTKKLLHNEGWTDSDNDGYLDKNSRPFELSLKTNAGAQHNKDVAVMIQAQLEKVGVKVKVEILDFNLLMKQIFDKRDFDVFLSGWDMDFTVNPSALFHSNAIDNGYNFVSYNNPKIDQLMEKGRSYSTPQQAFPVWAEFQNIILNDCPYTFLFTKENLAGYKSQVNGLRVDVRGFLSNIAEWWINTNI